MMYGCIGEHLPHSFSKEIHEQIGDYDYELKEIAPADLDAFMTARPFRAINVTIPYKQAVIPYLDQISETARAIGAVNTIVNRNGKLFGYNTDFDGLIGLIRRAGIDLTGKKVLILGTGGTSKTALHAARALGADRVLRVSRTAREDAVTYEAALRDHTDAHVILNTTPCGMYPHIEEAPLSPAAFPRLCGVIDAVYNPLRSRLVLEGRKMGVPAEGGLYMLSAQAVRAAEIFQGKQFPQELAEKAFRRVLKGKENIVLIGMPGSGKSAVADLLSRSLARPMMDTDRMIEEKTGMTIPDIFSRQGEKAFRDLETEAILSLAGRTGLVISTGGGAVLRQKNVDLLRHNGRLFWLDRDLSALRPTDDRPLADTREKMARLYQERRPIYQQAADEIVPVMGTAEEIAAQIESR